MKVDLRGKIFGRLTVLKFVEIRNGKTLWLCKCECSNKKLKIRSDSLINGSTKSCGCYAIENRTKHGACVNKNKEGSSQLLYVIWQGIKQRCYDKNSSQYKDYGGRGIYLYSRWKENFILFSKYVKALPNCPSETILISQHKGKRLDRSLDRINNNKSYKPGNLKWSNYTIQARNRRNNFFIEYKGKPRLLLDVVEKYSKLPYALVYDRIKKGNWDIHKALTYPVRIQSNNKKGN